MLSIGRNAYLQCRIDAAIKIFGCGTMGFRESLDSAMGNLACAAAQGYRTLTQNSPSASLFLGGAIPEIGSYLLERLYCNKDPYTEAFKPGRCPIRYFVKVTWKSEGSPVTAQNGTFTVNTSAWGPIGQATVRIADGGPGPGDDRFFLDLVNYGPDNLSRGQQVNSQIAGPGQKWNLQTITVLNTEATPLDPGADNNCGIQPDPPPYRPEDFTFPAPITYTPPGGADITIPFTAIVGLIYVDADLNVKMPVTFNVNPTANLNTNINFEFNATLNLNTGDVEVDFIPNGPGSPEPPALPPTSRPPITSPTNPAPPRPPSIPDAEPDPEDAEEGRQLVGVIVTSEFTSPNPNASTIFQGDNPNIQIPNLGYISFAIRTSSGAVAWTNDIPVKNLRAYIPVPENTTAIRAAGTPKRDVSWVLTPVYEKALVLVS